MKSAGKPSAVHRLRGDFEDAERLFVLTPGDNLLGADPESFHDSSPVLPSTEFGGGGETRTRWIENLN